MSSIEEQEDAARTLTINEVQPESTTKNVVFGLLYSFFGMLIGACVVPFPLAFLLDATHNSGINLFGFFVLTIFSAWLGLAVGFAVFAVRITKKPW